VSYGLLLIYHVDLFCSTSIACCPSWKRDPSSVALPEVSTIFLKGFLGEFFLIRCEGPKDRGMSYAVKPSEANCDL